MKRCTQCGREYDSSMIFCLDDRAELLYGPASADEPATAIPHSEITNPRSLSWKSHFKIAISFSIG
jgi:hypothetical protein